MPGSEKKPVKETQAIHPLAGPFASLVTAGTEAVFSIPLDKLKNNAQSSYEKHLKTPERIYIKLIGPNYHELTFSQSIRYCYRGIWPYIFNKSAARLLKFGGQDPLMKKIMASESYKHFSNAIGSKKATEGAAAASGGMLGLIEVGLNPLDRWKLLCQKYNLTSMEGFKRVWEEGLKKQYAGAAETAYRNIPGSFTLFGVKFYLYGKMGVTDSHQATFWQSLAASSGGSVACISVSHLFDIAKVRAQIDANNKMGVTKRLTQVVQQEGARALFEGLVPKLVNKGISLALALTVFDTVKKYANEALQQHPVSANGKFTPFLFKPAPTQSSVDHASQKELENKPSSPKANL